MSKTKSLVFAFLLTFLFSTQVVAGVGHQLSVGEQIRLVNQAKNLMQTFTGKHIFVKNSCVSYLINVNSPFYAGKKTMPLGEAMRARSIIVTPSRESPNLHFGWMYGHTNCVPYIVGNIKKNKAYLSGIQEFGSVAVANIPSAPNVLKVFYKSHYYLNHFLPILESSMARGVIEKKKGMESLATLKYQVRIYNLNNWRACKITGGHRFLHNCPHKTLFLRARESPIILPAAWGLHGTALQQRLQQVWQQADHLDAISTGPVHAARHILIFFDPNCPFCAHLWRSLQPWSARVRMRWVPVAFLRPSSLPMAATLLASKHPAQQLTQNEQHYQFRTRTGGILPLAQPPAGLLQQVRRNTALWLANFDVTPTLLYRGPHKLHDALGFPSHAQLRHWLGPA